MSVDAYISLEQKPNSSFLQTKSLSKSMMSAKKCSFSKAGVYDWCVYCKFHNAHHVVVISNHQVGLILLCLLWPGPPHSPSPPPTPLSLSFTHSPTLHLYLSVCLSLSLSCPFSPCLSLSSFVSVCLSIPPSFFLSPPLSLVGKESKRIKTQPKHRRELTFSCHVRRAALLPSEGDSNPL